MRKGDLVMCVAEFFEGGNEDFLDCTFPEAFKIYTVRETNSFGGKQTILLEEIRNKKVNVNNRLIEVQFFANCFDLVPVADLTELKELL